MGLSLQVINKIASFSSLFLTNIQNKHWKQKEEGKLGGKQHNAQKKQFKEQELRINYFYNFTALLIIKKFI